MIDSLKLGKHNITLDDLKLHDKHKFTKRHEAQACFRAYSIPEFSIDMKVKGTNVFRSCGWAEERS